MSNSYKYIDPDYTYTDPPDNNIIYEKYMKGTIESDLTILAD